MTNSLAVSPYDVPVDSMRILLVAASNATTGGGEKHVADLIRELSKRGVEVGLAAPAGGDLQRVATESRITYIPVEIASGVRLSSVRSLRKAIASFDPHITHAHGSRAALFARYADPRSWERGVYTIHGIHSDRGGASFIKLAIEQSLVNRTAHFITVCAADAKKGAALGILDAKKTTVIHNGIDVVDEGMLQKAQMVDVFHELSDRSAPQGPIILHIGRASAPKDHRTLLDAFVHVLKAVPSTTLALVVPGDRAAIDEIKDHAEQLGIDDSLLWLSPREDTLPLYASCNVFALSSLWEGLPYVILEAMGAGCAIASTDVGGISEVITSGKEGLLVEPSSPEQLGSAIATLLENPDLRLTYGTAARNRVSAECSLEGMIEKTLSVYEEVLAR